MKMTAKQARELLNYDDATGALVWLHRPRSMFTTDQKFLAWNTRYAGKQAGCVSTGTGYIVMSIFDRRELAHRVIWLMKTGEWPEQQIDHQDHQRANNRWSNLRSVSHAENGRNQSPRHSRRAPMGVSKRRDTGKWTARIGVDGGTKHLGCYATQAEAVAVRKAAERAAGFHPSHGARA